MYQPKYVVTNKILRNVGLIEAAREVIVNAPMVPAYEKKFREEALVRQVHFGTRLEGNDLVLPEAMKVVAEVEARDVNSASQITDVVGQERDIQEVVNYRRVMEYLGQLSGSTGGGKAFVYTEEMLQQIHHLTVDKLTPPESAGRFRKEQLAVRNTQTGEVFFRPPPGLEVPFLVKDVFEWLNSEGGREVYPIFRSGIIHYCLMAIHPYLEGNGRTVRAMATLVLLAEGYDIKKLFALEEYFDREAVKYYEVIARVSNQSAMLGERDLTAWLEFFTEGLATELTILKEKVRSLSIDSKITDRLGGKQVALSERQLRLVEYLQAQKEMTMVAAKAVVPMVSEDTILRDLKDLIAKELVAKRGVTKAAKYVLLTG